MALRTQSGLESLNLKERDAIEAVADLDHETYFDSIIVVQNCYTVNMYISVSSRTYMPSVQYESSHRIGKTTSFDPLFGKELPTYYYKSASYNDLESRMEMSKLLTCFISDFT
ncbi:hypothetical protein R6Q59_028695 [Mikania micrantha]